VKVYDRREVVRLPDEDCLLITRNPHFIIPLGAGLIGSVSLTGLYLGLVAWAESFQHAVEFFWQDRWIIFPIVLGLGIQVGLVV
jgi:hypothetical protein